MSKYSPPSHQEVLEAIASIESEKYPRLRRRAKEAFLGRKGWNRTSASKNGPKKRWLSPSDRIFAHLLYKAGITDRVGERILHCKWRNGMNFWNARNDGKRLLAARKRVVHQKTQEAEAVVA